MSSSKSDHDPDIPNLEIKLSFTTPVYLVQGSMDVGGGMGMTIS